MDQADVERFLALLNNLVNTTDKTWKEKRDAILVNASDDDKSNLAEFIGWFEEEDLD